MFRLLLIVTVMLAVMLPALFTPPVRAADAFPKPSLYPKSWELKFEHSKPKRVVVKDEKNIPRAYWYMTYTVTNNSDSEQLFIPSFDLVSEDGRITKDLINLPRPVFETIKKLEGARFLQMPALIGGALRIGPDQAKDGVAVWSEPNPEMGTFNIFVSGLSGETATVKDANEKAQILRKTLQLNYLIRGDEVYPGEDEVNENPEEWVMR